MATDRDARVVAMLEEMRMKGSCMRGNEHPGKKEGELPERWRTSSWTSLESEVDPHDRGQGQGEWRGGRCTTLGLRGRKKTNLRRSISADTLTSSTLLLDSGISVGDWWNCPSAGSHSQEGGVSSSVGAGADSGECYPSTLNATSSSCSVAADSAITNDDTGALTQDPEGLELVSRGEKEGDFPVGHVISCLGDVWRGPGVKKSQSVTERLQHGSLRATSIRSDLLTLLGQAEVEDQGLQEAAAELVAARSCGDAELEAEGERQLLLSRERREAILSKAEAMATHDHTQQEGTTPHATATVTISDLRVTVSTGNASTLAGGGRPQYCVHDFFLCLVRDSMSSSMSATEVEQLTGRLEGGRAEAVFHSTMRWVEQSRDFKLRVELYHLPAAPPPGTLEHSPARHWRVPSLLSRALSSSPVKTWKRRSTKHRRKGLFQGRTAGYETRDCSAIMSSRFSLVGHVEVTLDSGGGHLLAWLGPRFQIELDISFDPEWEEDCALEGFLTVQSGLGWEVLWCLLQGHFLYFWNYPEEVTQCKIPSHYIDLCCCKELALPASQEVCVRRNAILLSMPEGASLLVAESRADQCRWITTLNRVISIALTWRQT